jgi:hypothetical protein
MRAWHLQAFAISFLCFCFAGEALCEQSPEDRELIAEIKSRWKAQRENIRSVEFTLEVKETVGKGFFSAVAARFPGPPRDLPQAGAILPPEETVINTKRKVVIDGEKIYFDFSGPRYHIQEGYRECREKAVFNGKETRDLSETLKDKKHMQGSIHAGRHLMTTEDMTFLPLVFWLGSLWGDEEPFKIADTDKLESGSRDPLELLEVSDERGRRKMLLDPSRGYVVVRILWEHPTRPQQIEIAYDEPDPGVWRPLRWKFSQKWDQTGKVMEYELSDVKINSVVSPDVFEIDFPPGTLVIEVIDGKSKTSKVQPDGTREPVPRTRGSNQTL